MGLRVKNADRIAPRMRRVLAMIVLFILPMQWGFAAVAEYCAHETSPAAQVHLGHHDGQQAAKAKDADQDKSGDRGALDCPTCHQLCASAVLFDPSVATLDPSDNFHLPLYQSFLQRPPESPFRPPQVADA